MERAKSLAEIQKELAGLSIEELQRKITELEQKARAKEIEDLLKDSKGYSCIKCKDRGIVQYKVLEDGYTVVYGRCECQDIRVMENMMKSSNVTDEIKTKSFDNFKTDEVDKKLVDIKKMCMEYSDGLLKYYDKNTTLEGAPSLVICGTSGMGKTHLITAIAKDLIEKKRVVPYFFNWVSSFKEWFSYYTTGESDKVAKIREQILNAELLIIDDLCKDSGIKEAWVNEFYSIIDYRYRKGKPIVISTEFDTELITMLSEATYGRIYEMTENKKQNKHYFMRCFLKEDDDPLRFNYRLRSLR